MRKSKTYRVVLGPKHDDMVMECYHIQSMNKRQAKDKARGFCPSWWVIRECEVEDD